MHLSKVQIRHLDVSDPPVPPEGGIIRSPAGDLFQVLNGPAFRFLAYIEFDPAGNRPRGNHYHEHKVETLIVLHGRLRAAYLDIDTAEYREFELTRGDVVTVQPRCAHAYYPLEFSQALETAPESVAISDTHRRAVSRPSQDIRET